MADRVSLFGEEQPEGWDWLVRRIRGQAARTLPPDAMRRVGGQAGAPGGTEEARRDKIAGLMSPEDRSKAKGPEKKAAGGRKRRGSRVVRAMMGDRQRKPEESASEAVRDKDKPKVEAPRAADLPMRRGRHVEDADVVQPVVKKEVLEGGDVQPPAGIYEYAMTQPDLLRQAESGEMTSLDLLRELIKRREGPKTPPPGGGGFY